ncbi:GNAT family N-acetyltransferase [Candidatus Gracilibacteria bacterium]|nr:GNAT family N-acetyltransferase [Candidatus Gracilibacteria bacterium]
MKQITSKDTLVRGEKRLLEKMKSPKIYKWVVGVIFVMFGFKKKFFVFSKNQQTKKKALASVTTDSILGTKVSYIDDFIVDKGLRGKGVGKHFFGKLLDYIGNKKGSDYAVLVTRERRKASVHLYKKFGFTLLSVGVAYIAYKKMKK